MTTTHSYTGDQMILDGRHSDLRCARAGSCNIALTSTGVAKAVAAILPMCKGKLNSTALRVPAPNASTVTLVDKVSKSYTKEDVSAAAKTAADGPTKDLINPKSNSMHIIWHSCTPMQGPHLMIGKVTTITRMKDKIQIFSQDILVHIH